MVKDKKTKVAVPEANNLSFNISGESIARFFKESKVELKKVTWPTRQELIVNTIVVMVAVALCAVAIWIIDSIFSVVIRGILQ
jgi:preprotein translocase subunit SecE